MTVLPGVCYVCAQPKVEHTDLELRLGCHRPRVLVPTPNCGSLPPADHATSHTEPELEFAF